MFIKRFIQKCRILSNADTLHLVQYNMPLTTQSNCVTSHSRVSYQCVPSCYVKLTDNVGSGLH